MKNYTLAWIDDEENGFYSDVPAILIWEKAFGDEYPEKEEEPAKENKPRNADSSSSPTIDKPLLDERKNSVNDLGESNDNS